MPSKFEEIESQLPLLPGYRTKKPLTNYRKSHALDFTNGTRFVYDEKSGVGGPSGGDETVEASMKLVENPCPAWIAFEKKVLRFYGYFRAPAGNDIVMRRVIILYYLDDNTVQVSEKRIENSGIPQGTIVRRHQIIDTATKKVLAADQFNVGQDIFFYGRTYTILACDEFTRQFLTQQLGKEVAANQEYPEGTIVDKIIPRKTVPADSRISDPPRVDTHLKKFLQHDGHVLRFYGLWDDSASKFGGVHRVTLLYFLADESIEMRSHVKIGNIVSEPTFVRRGRLPRKLPEIKMDGSNLSQSNAKFNATEYYCEKDLKIGTALNVYGRTIALLDCDQFTRQYFAEKYGEPIGESIDFDVYDHVDTSGRVVVRKVEKVVAQKQHTVKVEEATIVPGGNTPKIKRYGVDDNCVLRFSARLKSPASQLDSERSFVVQYYHIDDTFAVFEKPLNNSGIPSGKFLERSHVKKAGTAEYLGPQDIAVNGDLTLFGRTFVLTEADAYSIKYMAGHKDLFTKQSGQQ